MTLAEIEIEMKDLYPRKEMAYLDYMDNSGCSEYGPRFWNEFSRLRDRWNCLVRKRNRIVKPDREILFRRFDGKEG